MIIVVSADFQTKTDGIIPAVTIKQEKLIGLNAEDAEIFEVDH